MKKPDAIKSLVKQGANANVMMTLEATAMHQGKVLKQRFILPVWDAAKKLGLPNDICELLQATATQQKIAEAAINAQGNPPVLVVRRAAQANQRQQIEGQPQHTQKTSRPK